jgi:competence protein ComEC
VSVDVHVLNVGAGASTLVEHANGHVTMVDVNDGGDQRSYEEGPGDWPLVDPISWCRDALGESVFRFILSHPDADHMAGLRRILLDEELDVMNFWDIPHKRTRTENDCRTEEAWHDWLAYQGLRRDLDVNGVAWPKLVRPLREEDGQFWTGDGIEVLSPTPKLVAEADAVDVYNNASYVLRIRHRTSSVLIASDVEEKAWRDMIADGVRLRANVLIASHHGRKSGYLREAVDLIRPEVVVVSSAKLKREHDGIPLYRQHTSHVYSTRTSGNLTITMWDDGDLDVYGGSGRRLLRLSD